MFHSGRFQDTRPLLVLKEAQTQTTSVGRPTVGSSARSKSCVTSERDRIPRKAIRPWLRQERVGLSQWAVWLQRIVAVPIAGSNSDR